MDLRRFGVAESGDVDEGGVRGAVEDFEGDFGGDFEGDFGIDLRSDFEEQDRVSSEEMTWTSVSSRDCFMTASIFAVNSSRSGVASSFSDRSVVADMTLSAVLVSSFFETSSGF